MPHDRIETAARKAFRSAVSVSRGRMDRAGKSGFHTIDKQTAAHDARAKSAKSQHRKLRAANKRRMKMGGR